MRVLFVCAETLHRRLILEERPLAMRKAFTFGQFARGLSALAEPRPNLLEEIRARAATSTGSDDVIDPYGRGIVSAGTAARQLDRLLWQILPELANAMH